MLEAETLCSLLVLGSFECNHSLSGCQLVETDSVYDDDCELLNCNRNIFNAATNWLARWQPSGETTEQLIWPHSA